MAAQNKTTAVHFSLIFFVMLSVILGVVAYLFYADYREQTAQLDAAKKEATGNKTAYDKTQAEVNELKKLVGLDLAEVGVSVPGDNTVLTQGTQAIQQLGDNASAPSFVVALRDMRTALDNKTAELAQRQATIADLEQKLVALNASYKTREDEHDKRALARRPTSPASSRKKKSPSR